MNRAEKEQIKKDYFDLSTKLTKQRRVFDEYLLYCERELALNALALENSLSPDDLFLAIEHTRQKNNYSKDNPLSLAVVEYDCLITTFPELRHRARRKNRLEFDDLLELHFNLYQRTRYNIAGKLRKNKPDQSAINNGGSPHTILEEQCTQHLEWLWDRLNLFETVSDANFFEIFYVATEIHLRFRQAHPFEHGSMVIAVLLYNYVHYYTGLLPNIIYYDDRQLYFEQLKKSNMADFTGLINFFLASFEKTNRINRVTAL